MHNLVMRLLLLCLLILVAPSSLKAQTPPVWHTDKMEALHIAEMSGKPFLIVFNGTGWDKASDTFMKDFSSDPGFPALASRVVLLRVDMPSAPITPSTEEEIQRNNLAVFFRIDTVPTVILCDTEMIKTKARVLPSGQPVHDVVSRLLQSLPN